MNHYVDDPYPDSGNRTAGDRVHEQHQRATPGTRTRGCGSSHSGGSHQVAEQRDRLKEFSRRCLRDSFKGKDTDGGDMQEWGKELGLLHEVTVTEPCSESDCICAETDDFPQTCLRYTPEMETVRERGILFSGEMVRAILDGRKTQTRREMTPQPDAGSNGRMVDLGGGSWGLLDGCLSGEWRCPYGEPGDRLWVRETWYCDDYREKPGVHGATVEELRKELYYRADGEAAEQFEAPEGSFWRPSIHMPRWASRLTLSITDVRVQRLQEISENDALAEGVRCNPDLAHNPEAAKISRRFGPAGVNGMVSSFFAQTVWDPINAKRGSGWDQNPWCWCLTFRRLTP